MACWRFRLQRNILRYVDGELDAADAARLERHLLDCQWCREKVVRLKAATQYARQLPRVAPWRDAESDYEAMMARATGTLATPAPPRRAARIRLGALVNPRVVTALIAIVVLQSVLLVESNKGVLFGQRTAVTVKAGELDAEDFRDVSIPDIRSNTQPHVVTEGYVSDVHTDEEEGTVAFKLADRADGGGSFVVCEIIAPIKVATPVKGSYVRVYGVTRYDAQSDRRWYEINPVLEINPTEIPASAR